VARCAPRLDSRLIAATGRIDKSSTSIAETYRRVALVAENLGLPRPSYESIRRIAHLIRARRRDPGIGEVLLDIDLRRRHSQELVDALAGDARRLPK
jgi:hypothetical protein